MAQSGLLIPTLDGSQLSVFKMYIVILVMNNQSNNRYQLFIAYDKYC